MLYVLAYVPESDKQMMVGMVDTSPLPFHPPPISKFANSKFTIVTGHAFTLTLNPNPKGLNPNPKSQTKTLPLTLSQLTLCPNPNSLKS